MYKAELSGSIALEQSARRTGEAGLDAEASMASFSASSTSFPPLQRCTIGEADETARAMAVAGLTSVPVGPAMGLTGRLGAAREDGGDLKSAWGSPARGSDTAEAASAVLRPKARVWLLLMLGRCAIVDS